MNIGILSRGPRIYSTRRLREAAEERGHEVQVVDYVRCIMGIASRNPTVIYRGQSLDFDAVIPRIGASYTFYGTAVVRQFEMKGVFAANDSQAIVRSRDKLRSLQLLAGAGLDLPISGFSYNSGDVDGLIALVGGAPLVVKLLEGTQGTGVVLAETKKAAESVIGAFRQLDANILIQEFIHEAGGADYRAFVVDGEVVAAMKRQALPGEFRSNLHRGGSASVADLTRNERRLAVRAAQIMELGIAGVDILRSERGPLVLEVNSSPGLEGIEKATDVDVASTVVQYLERRVSAGLARGTGIG